MWPPPEDPSPQKWVGIPSGRQPPPTGLFLDTAQVVDAELDPLLKHLETFGGVPMQGGKQATPECRQCQRHLIWKMLRMGRVVPERQGEDKRGRIQEVRVGVALELTVDVSGCKSDKH